jgi:type I restriction enzyme S subunit
MVSRWFFEDGLVNQHIFKVIPKDGYPDWLVFGLIESQMPLFLSLAADKATTMGHIQRGHLDLPVPSLGPTQVEELGAEVRGLWEEELALRSELLNIEAARAELLPLLLSGRIVVREEAA